MTIILNFGTSAMAYDEKTNIEPRHISMLAILLKTSLNEAVSKKKIPTIKEDQLTTQQKEVIWFSFCKYKQNSIYS